MRKTLLVLALAGLAGIWIITTQAIYGAHALPARFATHFDAAGNANGWGSPKMLWLLPIIATAMAVLLTLVSRYPGAFNYPVRITPGMRPRLEAITLNMIAWLRVELVLLFLWIQYAIIQSARAGSNRVSPWFVPFVIVLVFATIGWHFAAILRVGRSAARR